MTKYNTSLCLCLCLSDDVTQVRVIKWCMLDRSDDPCILSRHSTNELCYIEPGQTIDSNSFWAFVCIFVVIWTLIERVLKVSWVVGYIRHGGPIELFLVPANAPRLV